MHVHTYKIKTHDKEKRRTESQLGVATHVCNPSPRDAEAGKRAVMTVKPAWAEVNCRPVYTPE